MFSQRRLGPDGFPAVEIAVVSRLRVRPGPALSLVDFASCLSLDHMLHSQPVSTFFGYGRSVGGFLESDSLFEKHGLIPRAESSSSRSGESRDALAVAQSNVRRLMRLHGFAQLNLHQVMID